MATTTVTATGQPAGQAATPPVPPSPAPAAAGQVPQGGATSGQVTPPVQPSDDKPLGPGGERALQAERDARRQIETDLAAANARIREFEDANKSDAEKAAERDAERQRATDDAIARATRYEVCASEGMPLSAAKFLAGRTEAEIRASAAELKPLLATAGAQSAPGGLAALPVGAGNPSSDKASGVQAGADMYQAQRRKVNEHASSPQ